ncbi:MAG: hypothetical protein M5R42_15795 [Rhodocyclaceae bacterium]|nr:hypothetical protein [Rhodocyclaceae bacterium]
MTGFLWGMAIWLLIRKTGEHPRLFLVLTVCIVSLGGTAALSPSRTAYHAFMAPMIFPSVFFLLFGQTDSIATAGWSVLIYIAVLVAVHDALYRNLAATFRARFTSEALAAEHGVIFDSATEPSASSGRTTWPSATVNGATCSAMRRTKPSGRPPGPGFRLTKTGGNSRGRCMAPIVRGEPYKEILQLRRKNGELFWAEISGRVVDPANL